MRWGSLQLIVFRVQQSRGRGRYFSAPPNVKTRVSMRILVRAVNECDRKNRAKFKRCRLVSGCEVPIMARTLFFQAFLLLACLFESGTKSSSHMTGGEQHG